MFLIEDEIGNASKWKDSLAERIASRQSTNLMQLVYGKPAPSSTGNEVQKGSNDEESDDEEFFKPKEEGEKVRLIDSFEIIGICVGYTC